MVYYFFAEDDFLFVDLYIGLGSATDSQKMLDDLLEHRKTLEKEIGESIIVQKEHPDDSKACRIIIKRKWTSKNESTSSPNSIAERRWGIEKLIKFKNAFSPLLSGQ